jgi:hypothetical protein
MAGHVERTSQIDAEHGFPRAWIHLFDARRRPGDAGIVDEDVEPAKRPDSLGHHCLDGAPVADIAPDLPAPGSSVRSSASAAASRSQTWTFATAASKACTIARPMPEAPAVTRTRLRPSISVLSALTASKPASPRTWARSGDGRVLLQYGAIVVVDLAALQRSAG